LFLQILQVEQVQQQYKQLVTAFLFITIMEQVQVFKEQQLVLMQQVQVIFHLQQV
jgi:hypothetical protein